MFIDRIAKFSSTPFGGAEINESSVIQDAFRSSERRGYIIKMRVYKHLTPTE